MISCHASPVAHLGGMNERRITRVTFAWRQKRSLVSGLDSCPPKEEEHGLREGLEVVVPVDVRAVHHSHLSEHLERPHWTNTFIPGT